MLVLRSTSCFASPHFREPDDNRDAIIHAVDAEDLP